jgi:hypothetical protein
VTDLSTSRPQSELSRNRLWLYLAALGPVIASSILTVFAVAVPGGEFTLIMIAPFSWLLSLCAWVAVLAIDRLRRRRVLVLVPPLLAAVTFALAAFGIPMRAAFLISEAPLTEYANALPEQEQWSESDGRAGLFTLDGARRWQGVTQLNISNSGGFLTGCGFAHAPDGHAKDIDASTIDHVTGNWYAFCTDFD